MADQTGAKMTKAAASDIRIKDFGRDLKCSSVVELQSTLSKHYKSQHVSIVYPAKPSGLLRTIFVSVDDTGGVNETYGDQSPVDFSAIKDELFKGD